MTLLITIYLIGCVVAYVWIRHNYNEGIEEWTMGDRNMTIFLSLGSIITVLFICFVSLIISFTNDKPAKW